jgi:hypothetical protein
MLQMQRLTHKAAAMLQMQRLALNARPGVDRPQIAQVRP